MQKVEAIDEQVIILNNPYNSALVTLYLNGSILPAKPSHAKEFLKHYKQKGYKIKPELHMKVIPIQHKNHPWTHDKSKKLRGKFRSAIDDMLATLGSFSNVSVRNFAIDAQDVQNYEFISDQFGDVAGFSIKKAKKRKEDRSGASINLSKIYNDKKQTDVAFLISSNDEKHKNEWASSSHYLNKFQSMIHNAAKLNGFDEDMIIKNFLLKSNSEIVEKFKQKASVFIGLKNNGQFKYTLMGGVALYGYDGNDFNLIEEDNDFYLGSAVQFMKTKNGGKVFDLLSPDMIKIKTLDSKKYVGLLVVSSNLQKAITDKRRIRAANAKEYLEKFLKRSKAAGSDAGALFFYL